MKNWHILYNTNTGKAVSIGTVLADPIPEELTSLPLTDEEGDGLTQGLYKWDENQRALIAVEKTEDDN
jgi:hypothetical protein